MIRYSKRIYISIYSTKCINCKTIIYIYIYTYSSPIVRSQCTFTWFFFVFSMPNISQYHSTYPHLWSKRPQVLPEIREPPIWPQHVVPAVPLGILRRGRVHLIGKSYRFLLETMRFFPWFFPTWGRLADLKCWNRWTHLGHTRNPKKIIKRKKKWGARVSNFRTNFANAFDFVSPRSQVRCFSFLNHDFGLTKMTFMFFPSVSCSPWKSTKHHRARLPWQQWSLCKIVRNWTNIGEGLCLSLSYDVNIHN